MKRQTTQILMTLQRKDEKILQSMRGKIQNVKEWLPQVVEILIENAELLFPDPASSPELDLRSVEVQTPGSSPHPLTRY